MAIYKISGVWKDENGAITDYAFHEVESEGITRAAKISKATAIHRLESGDTAVTWVWNYKEKRFNNGENVEVVRGSEGKYLRSSRDNQLTDNLGHLIDFDWIDPLS